MLRALPLIALLPLSGCFTMQQDLTPWQRCLHAQTGELRALRHAAQVTRLNLARGYAVTRAELPGVTFDTCSSGGLGPCLVDSKTRLDLPTPIDPAREEARLATLDARIEARRPAAYARTIAACGPAPDPAR